jgi:hypothetical protein
MTASGFQQLTLARAIEEVETERERAANIMGEKLEFLWLPGVAPGCLQPPRWRDRG